MLICAFDHLITCWVFYYKTNFITISYIIDRLNCFLKFALNSTWLGKLKYTVLHAVLCTTSYYLNFEEEVGS